MGKLHELYNGNEKLQQYYGTSNGNYWFVKKHVPRRDILNYLDWLELCVLTYTGGEAIDDFFRNPLIEKAFIVGIVESSKYASNAVDIQLEAFPYLSLEEMREVIEHYFSGIGIGIVEIAKNWDQSKDW